LKIFGVEIFKRGQFLVKDAVPDIKAPVPQTKRPALMRPVRDPVMRYRTTRSVGRGAFNPAEYDLAEIGRIEDTDSYVRQAFDKKVALMFKEGWDITGKNLKTIRYIKTRFAQIARASGVPTRALFRSIGSSLIRKSNAFVIKVRNIDASGGEVRREPGKKTTMKPVAGYFIAPAETMHYQQNGHKITKWRQKMPNGEYKDYSPKDIIHIHYDRKDGFVFGTPTLVPVIDDIRALRKIEENIEMLVYQHLFPLFQYKVGTDDRPAGVTEDGQLEVDIVRREIQFMPSEGGIVTPERHEIKVIGAEGRALRAEAYLEHFKKRVLSGLSVSTVDMGEGHTANRATADNMSRNLIDAVKDFQQVLETFINEYIINELLLESTFGSDVLDEENICHMKFKEIDVDAQIKKENHYADLFEKDIIDHDEARRGAGLEPLEIPTREEIESEEDTALKYPQWHRMRWKLFQEPTLLIQSLDEPWSAVARAVAKNSLLELSQKDVEEVGQAQSDQEVALEKERSKAKVAVAKATPSGGKATNVGTRPSRPKRVQNGYLQQAYLRLTQDVVSRVSQEQKLDHDWAAQMVRAELDTTIQRLIAEQVLSFRSGYSSQSNITPTFANKVTTARGIFTDRANHYVSRLANHVVSSLKRRVNNDTDPAEIARATRAVLESFRYRTDFIEDVEIRKAYSLGVAYGLRAQQVDEIYSVARKEACSACKSHHAQPIELEHVVMDDVPPYHASCSCALTQYKEMTQLRDATVLDAEGSLPPPKGVKMSEEPADKPLPDTGGHAKCPKCGKTAIKKKDTPDIYICRACKTSFRVVTDVEDAASQVGPRTKRAGFLKCVARAKARLRSQHPDWDEGRIEIAAEVACDHHLQDEEEVENLTDGEKMDRCVSRVKARLRKKNPNMSEEKATSSAFAICNSQLKGK